MNRHDKARWKACATLADIGECVCDWITGAIVTSPDYGGGPHGETRRHARLLCAVNRAGFVTNAMNDEGVFVPNAHVAGFIRPARVPRLYMAARQHGVELHEMPRRVKRETVGYYGDYVQESAVREMERARYVLIEDPVNGRFSRRSPLWVALREFAR